MKHEVTVAGGCHRMVAHACETRRATLMGDSRARATWDRSSAAAVAGSGLVSACQETAKCSRNRAHATDPGSGASCACCHKSKAHASSPKWAERTAAFREGEQLVQGHLDALEEDDRSPYPEVGGYQLRDLVEAVLP